MKAEDIITRLATRLPVYSDYFTTNVDVLTLTRSGTTVTVTTDGDHGFSTGEAVNIQGAQTPLTVASLTRSGTVGTVVTDNAHDFTEGVQTEIEISGATEAEFNGTFTILSVDNRKTVTFTMADSGATTATGTPLVLNGASVLQQYNGLWAVATVPTTDSFTYEITDTTLYSPAAGTIVAKSNPRVSGSATFERLIDSYTDKPSSQLWLFVILGDVAASKNRAIESDAVDNQQRGNEWRQQVIQNVDLYVFIPTAGEIAGRTARDLAEDLFRPICQSILGASFDSGLAVGAQNPVNFVTHGIISYNGAFYVHGYTFQAVADILFEDTVGYDDDVAFRDIDLTMAQDQGTGSSLTATIDLDDVLL